jgi:multiple sugar transport system ATP-binding protein
MAEVVFEQVSKRYPNGVLAVRDLSLTVADGEFVVLVGPSGCGKTTTLRLLAGLEQPTHGTLRIAGRVVNDLRPSQRDIALVFQRPALYPHLSVRDNLAFSLRLRQHVGFLTRLAWRCLRPARYTQLQEQDQLRAERVAQTARLLGLEDVLERLPGQLSGGQQQRVALGRALVRQPAAFLLDEPLSNLDAPLRVEMRRELHLLHRRLPATMLYVTHDQVEAMTLGDRVVVLKEGVVQQVDRPMVLYERPCNRFVAGFIGWPPMNLLDGQLVHSEGRLGFLTQGQWLPLPPGNQPGNEYAGRPLTLGVRPEEIRVDESGVGWRVSMVVVLVEPLGSMSLVTLHRGGWQLTAQTNARQVVVERQTVEVNWDMERAHWFDGQSGVALDRLAGSVGRLGNPSYGTGRPAAQPDG